MIVSFNKMELKKIEGQQNKGSLCLFDRQDRIGYDSGIFMS